MPYPIGMCFLEVLSAPAAQEWWGDIFPDSGYLFPLCLYSKCKRKILICSECTVCQSFLCYSRTVSSLRIRSDRPISTWRRLVYVHLCSLASFAETCYIRNSWKWKGLHLCFSEGKQLNYSILITHFLTIFYFLKSRKYLLHCLFTVKNNNSHFA